MDRLFIEPTESTLHVDFDPQNGTLAMRGESYPENAIKFFSPILDWLKQYLGGLQAGARVLVNMDIVYFNSSSSKALMNCFDAFDDAARRGVRVDIAWHHHEENEIAKECGEEFGEELEAASFTIRPYKDSP